MQVRRAAKIDANQAQIVADLRTKGVQVLSLAAVGGGVPDLLCGWKGRLVLLEVKDGAKVPSARRLTPFQEAFHQEWEGMPLYVVDSTPSALKAVGVTS